MHSILKMPGNLENEQPGFFLWREMFSLYSSWVTCALVRLKWVAISDGATFIAYEKEARIINFPLFKGWKDVITHDDRYFRLGESVLISIFFASRNYYETRPWNGNFKNNWRSHNFLRKNWKNYCQRNAVMLIYNSTREFPWVLHTWRVGETVNSHAFHACIHGFESRTRHHM